MRYIHFLIILMIFTVAPQQAIALNIQDIRLGGEKPNTRIVIDLDQGSPYTHRVIENPSRLVIDFPSNAGVSPSALQKKGYGIESIRWGQPDPQTKRLVFDIHGSFMVDKHFLLPPGVSHKQHRLVFDLKPTTGHNQSANNITATNATQAPTVPSADARTHEAAIGNLPTPKPSAFDTPRQKYTVVLDAGHGGGDPGAIGHGGVQEKAIVFSIAQKIKRRLEATGRYNVYLTRTGDYHLPLRDRFQRARNRGANLFISIHADKIDSPNVRGASVYTLSETASDAETARLAVQENNAGIIAGVDLGVEEHDVANILLDLVRRESLNESKLFAELLVASLRENNIRTLNNPHRYAGFAVLKAPDVPSVLIEAGFLSNREDAILLQNENYQNQLAQAIQLTADRFFDRLERLNN